MERVKLNIFERLYLNHCVKRDLKNEQIRSFLIEKTRLNILQIPKVYEARGLDDHLVNNLNGSSVIQKNYDEDSSAEKTEKIRELSVEYEFGNVKSSRIVYEVNCYSEVKSRMLYKKNIYYRLKNRGFGKIFFTRKKGLGNAVEDIDNRIEDVKKEIALLQDQYGGKIKDLDKEKEKYEGDRNHRTTQTVQAYSLMIDQCREEYKSHVYDKYRDVLFLYGEKIRIIERVSEKVKAVRSKRLFRIQYYYTNIGKYSKLYPILSFSNEDFGKLSDEREFDSYIKTLTETKAIREKLLEELLAKYVI